MAQHIRVGTQLDVGGPPLDVYVVERITKTATGKAIAVRTHRQRIFPGTVQTVFTEAAIRTKVVNGTMRVIE